MSKRKEHIQNFIIRHVAVTDRTCIQVLLKIHQASDIGIKFCKLCSEDIPINTRCALEAVQTNLLVVNDGNGNAAMPSNSLITELIERVEVLEARDERLQQDIDDMKNTLGEQKKEITILHKKNAQQGYLISKLLRKLQLRTWRSESSSPVGNNEGTDTHNDKTVSRIQASMKSANRIRQAENEVTIAFTAGLSQNMLHVGQHQNIVFDHVVTNTGNGYNPQHGAFTAPVAGTYVFYTSILAYNNREVWLDIFVNGHGVASVYVRGTDGRHDQGSQMIVVQLKQGDDVAVQNRNTDEAVYGGMYTTFSGYLLQQDYSQSTAILG